MDILAIINSIIAYGSVILGIMFIFVTAVQLITEVVKRLLPRVPTDLVVFMLSVALVVLAMWIYCSIMTITVMWYYAVGAVVMGIFVAYAAMFGWDKFTAIISRLKEYWAPKIDDIGE